MSPLLHNASVTKIFSRLSETDEVAFVLIQSIGSMQGKNCVLLQKREQSRGSLVSRKMEEI